MKSVTDEYIPISTFEQTKEGKYGAISISSDTESHSPKFFSFENIGIIANTMSILLAAAIFSIPWSFFEAGIFGGLIIVSFSSFLSCRTIMALLEAQKSLYLQSGQVYDYPDIAAKYLGGRGWATSVITATSVSCIGGCAGFVIFIGQICSQELGLPLKYSIGLLSIPMIFLSWIRSFRELAVFTVFGVCSVVLAVGAIFIEGYPVDQSTLEVKSLDIIPTIAFLGNATFLFTIHYCVLAMGAETLRAHQNQSSMFSEIPLVVDRLTLPVNMAFVLGTVVVACLGLVGPLVYSGKALVRDSRGVVVSGCEDTVCQNIVLNLPPGLPRAVVGVMLVTSIIITYMVLLAPAREHIENFVIRVCKPSSGTCTIWLQNTVRTVLVLSTCVIATHTPYFGSVLQTVGGITDAFQSYVVPALIYLQMIRLMDGHGSVFYFYVFVLVFGIGLVLFTMYLTTESIYAYNSTS